MGPAQVHLVAWSSLSFIPVCLMFLVTIFTTLDPVQEHWWSCTNSTDAACQAVWAMPSPGTSFCGLSPDQWEWTHKSWSLVSELGLTCGEAWKASFLNSFYFVGLAAGGTIFGAMSDRFGRRNSLYLCTVLGIATCALSTAGSNFWLYLFWRMVNAMALQGMMLCDVVLVTEPVGASYRGRVGIVSQAFFILGEVLLAALAYWVHPWRVLTLLCAGVSCTFLLTWFFVPESPRWLASQGKSEKAMHILEDFAHVNGHTIPAGTHLREQRNDLVSQSLTGSESTGITPAASSALATLGSLGQLQHSPSGLGPSDSGQLQHPTTGLASSGSGSLHPSALANPTASDEKTALIPKPAGAALAHLPWQQQQQQQPWTDCIPEEPSTAAGRATPEAAAEADTAKEESSALLPARHLPSDAPGQQPSPSSSSQQASATNGPSNQQQQQTAASAAGAAARTTPVTVGGLPQLHHHRHHHHHNARHCTHGAHEQNVLDRLVITPYEALRHPSLLLRFCVMSVAVFSFVMAYYGVSFGVGSFSGNPVVNFLLLALAELPSSIIVALLIDRIGRVPIMLAGLLISGLTCIICTFVPPSAIIYLALGAKFGSSAAWNCLVVYSSEVLPTSVRSVLSGSVNLTGRVGGVVVPFLFLAANSSGMRALPFWVIGIACLGSAVVAVTLPETCGLPQPDTLRDFDALVASGNVLTQRVAWLLAAPGRLLEQLRNKERHQAVATEADRDALSTPAPALCNLPVGASPFSFNNSRVPAAAAAAAAAAAGAGEEQEQGRACVIEIASERRP